MKECRNIRRRLSVPVLPSGRQDLDVNGFRLKTGPETVAGLQATFRTCGMFYNHGKQQNSRMWFRAWTNLCRTKTYRHLKEDPQFAVGKDVA